MKKTMCALALLLATFAEAEPPARIDNGPDPAMTIRNWHLKETWRAGPEGDGYLFGRIIDVARDDAGRIYVLDYQQQETYVFDLSGNLVQVLGRKGEGPGETTMASNLLVGPDHFGLLNRFPAEIVRLDEDGDPAGSVTLNLSDAQDAFLGCWYGRYRHGGVVVGFTDTKFDGKIKSTHDYLAGFAPDGTLGPIYVDFGEGNPRESKDGVADEGVFYEPLAGRWDLDERGRVWIAPHRDPYLLQVRNESGEVILEVTREYDRPPRTPAEYRRARASFERRWSKTDLPVKIADHAPCVEKLWIMENPWGSEVWVQSGAALQSPEPGAMIRYDIFNLDGEFTHQVDIVGDADPLFDRFHLVGNNRLILIRNASDGGYEEDDPSNPRYDDADVEVISYCIVWEE